MMMLSCLGLGPNGVGVSSAHTGAFRPLWYCTWAAYAQFIEDSGQLYGNIRGLPSSFKYWKFRFFFVSGDDFETLASEAWGDIPRLLRRWETSNLGVSIFLIAC